MKRIAIVSCSICLILALVHFYRSKKDSPAQKDPIEVKVEKKLEINRDKKPKTQVSKKKDNKKAPTPSKKANESEIVEKPVETEEQKKVKKSLVKRNQFYKNSDIEVVNIDTVSNRSSVIIRTKHEGQNYSFSALIDNKTGKIIKTWGRTIFERRK